MTDLPKLTLGEFQNMVNTLDAQKKKAYGVGPVVPTPKSPRRTAASRRCPCTCVGCTDPNNGANHCLSLPCTRQRNRRSPAEIAADGRYDTGRPIAPGRDPSKRRRASKNDPFPTTPPPKPDPIRPVVEWFVMAHRNHTEVVLGAPGGRDEAYTVAGNLFMAGWKVQVLEP